MLAANVKRLATYKTKLVLFPTVAGKPKKGLIADATAEQLKNVEQNSTEGVLALPDVKKRCKLEALTKEMKSEKTYQKLRQVRINKRYNGKRIKRAEEAERAKK